jgi:hypothetical protein
MTISRQKEGEYATYSAQLKRLFWSNDVTVLEIWVSRTCRAGEVALVKKKNDDAIFQARIHSILQLFAIEFK